MLKPKNDAYKVPRREKIFRVLTICALLLAMGILIRDLLKAPPTDTATANVPVLDATRVPNPCPDTDAILNKIAAGGDIFLDCSAVLHFDHTFVIDGHTRISGSGEHTLILTGDKTLPTLFRVEEGGVLILENLRLAESLEIAIYVQYGGELQLNRCRFENLVGINRLGAAIRNHGGKVSIHGCLFKDNAPKMGLLIYNQTGGQLDIYNTIFQSNQANILQNEGTTRIMNSVFQDNSAGVSNSGDMTIQFSAFQGQTGGFAGTALGNTQTGKVRLEQVSFDNNNGQAGSTIWNAGTIEMKQVTFLKNIGVVCQNYGNGTISPAGSC